MFVEAVPVDILSILSSKFSFSFGNSGGSWLSLSWIPLAIIMEQNKTVMEGLDAWFNFVYLLSYFRMFRFSNFKRFTI